jgi:hypothetical protein
MTNQEFIDYLISKGFEEQELFDTPDRLSTEERLFVFKNVSVYVHVSGTRLFYMNIDAISAECKTPKQGINNALKLLRWKYEDARDTLLEVKKMMKS